MTNETEQLRRLVDAREKATKGEWSVCQFEGTGFKNQVMVSPTICTAYGDEGEALANAELIALSGNIDLRAILTRMEKMEAALIFYSDKENWKSSIKQSKSFVMNAGEYRPQADDLIHHGHRSFHPDDFEVVPRDKEKPVVPDGMVLVPMEPSEAMKMAGVGLMHTAIISSDYTWADYASNVYKAMIAVQGKENG